MSRSSAPDPVTRAADAERWRGCARPISCSTTRWSTSASSRLARRAQRFFVGKRAGRHALTQTEIHALMIRAARRGRRVVRLKGGDPFVFGRGGEEALALARAGVPFEVVPGVTSAIAAPALAGIPVTHRGHRRRRFSSSAGTTSERFPPRSAALQPNGVTRGRADGLRPAAAIACGADRRAAGAAARRPRSSSTRSRPEQQVWRGTLDDLAAGRVDDRDGAARHDRDRRRRGAGAVEPRPMAQAATARRSPRRRASRDVSEQVRNMSVTDESEDARPRAAVVRQRSRHRRVRRRRSRSTSAAR